MNIDNTLLITNLLNDVDKMNDTGIKPNNNINVDNNSYLSNRQTVIASCSLISLGMLGYLFHYNWVEKLSTRINKFTIR